ncbi:MAG TPA: response regulator [Bacteroidia bacterium]|nr:response regulator [Bacteroidia bacterium]
MIALKPKKIFIVDDDEMQRVALEDYITMKTPHKVRTFGTGEECLRSLDEEPDIIILDYYLNTVQKDAANGMEILQKIKKNYPKIHIIMLSSQERYAVAMQTIQKGAEQYVIKDEDAFEKIAGMIEEM